MHRRVLPIAASASTASLALLGAAWAATGALPLVGDADPARAPLAITAQATGPLIANDRNGQAILTAPAMRPGVPAVGEVTVSNAGNAVGLFTLSSAGAADGPGALSGVLDLVVSDVTQGAGTTLYTGKLATFGRLPLGALAAGAARRYRFALTFPAGRPDVADNALQGATTSVAFDWNTVAVAGPPAPNGPTPTPAPMPPAPAPARTTVPAPSGSKTGTAAPAAGTRVPVPATPAGGGVAGMRLSLGAARRQVVKKRLVVWMTSTGATSARVTGTVTVGRKRYKLRAASVTLTAKRRTVRLRLPRQASGRRQRLTVRLTVSAGSGRARVTLRRTLRVRTP